MREVLWKSTGARPGLLQEMEENKKPGSPSSLIIPRKVQVRPCSYASEEAGSGSGFDAETLKTSLVISGRTSPFRNQATQC